MRKIKLKVQFIASLFASFMTYKKACTIYEITITDHLLRFDSFRFKNFTFGVRFVSISHAVKRKVQIFHFVIDKWCLRKFNSDKTWVWWTWSCRISWTVQWIFCERKKIAKKSDNQMMFTKKKTVALEFINDYYNFSVDENKRCDLWFKSEKKRLRSFSIYSWQNGFGCVFQKNTSWKFQGFHLYFLLSKVVVV